MYSPESDLGYFFCVCCACIFFSSITYPLRISYSLLVRNIYMVPENEPFGTGAACWRARSSGSSVEPA